MIRHILGGQYNGRCAAWRLKFQKLKKLKTEEGVEGCDVVFALRWDIGNYLLK
jgi:hypothetical protein